MLLESAMISLFGTCMIIVLTALGGSPALGVSYALNMALVNIIPVLLVVQVSLWNNNGTVTTAKIAV
ncbi:hypothetical protein B0H19DRAFT_1185629 [Mycena capillaripes]|nr:hypothetical protein B0H19DRAFT_1185629 [Mycena capillaripes]